MNKRAESFPSSKLPIMADMLMGLALVSLGYQAYNLNKELETELAYKRFQVATACRLINSVNGLADEENPLNEEEKRFEAMCAQLLEEGTI